MEGITGMVTFFGLPSLGIPISQLLVFLCVLVLVFLFILEVEFRQIRKLAKKLDDEDLVLTKDLRELRDAVREISGILGRKESPGKSRLEDEKDMSDKEENMDRKEV
ncbi:MAG: hypothetical protein ACP5E4_02155 [Candidatus Aenigmatarchaeota archaeon]